MRAHIALFIAAVHAITSTGCAQLWVGRGGVVEQARMTDAHGESVYLFDDIDLDDIPDIETPERLRPCCAFGSGLQVSVGELPIHGFSLDNVRSADDIGQHNYNNGVISFGGSDGAMLSNERNGLVYTCRGGFIDSAHLRDYADWMLFFTVWFAKRLDTGGSIELSSEAGTRRITLAPVAPELIRTHRVRALSMKLARYVAFRLSIWHELATWYGWSSIPLFTERASAFSPEDLYSNILGIAIAQSVIEVGGVGSEEQYNQNMDDWIEEVLERMGAIPAEDGVRMAHALDGYWWDSKRRLPDPGLVKSRYMNLDYEIHPWTASLARSPEADAIVHEVCSDGADPIVFGNSEMVGPVPISSLVRFEIEIDPELTSFPIPRPPSRVVNQDDFPALIEAIRAAARIEFGPGADEPTVPPASTSVSDGQRP